MVGVLIHPKLTTNNTKDLQHSLDTKIREIHRGKVCFQSPYLIGVNYLISVILYVVAGKALILIVQCCGFILEQLPVLCPRLIFQGDSPKMLTFTLGALPASLRGVTCIFDPLTLKGHLKVMIQAQGHKVTQPPY